ncbi:MAG: IS110 family transposase, partial [Chloroflexota bacterium]
EDVLAEIGTDVSRFPNAAHLASWAKVCPGNNESAGKRKSGRTGHGNPWLLSTLVEVAQAAGRTKNTYLSAQYHRLAARRGAKRAAVAVAVAHTILVIVYHLLRKGTSYIDLGQNYFDERARLTTVQRAVQRIERLGYQVALQPT